MKHMTKNSCHVKSVLTEKYNVNAVWICIMSVFWGQNYNSDCVIYLVMAFFFYSFRIDIDDLSTIILKFSIHYEK